MICAQPVQYVIRAGDNLYQLSRHYQTTVPAILALNPHTDPYNLKIGSTLTICPGDGFVPNGNNHYPPSCPNPSRQMALVNGMRLVWSQHVYWTRMLIISIAERLKDLSATQNRLLRNPGDMGALFGQYYSSEVAKKIAQLITEHLQIGAQLITALRDGQRAEADMLSRQWTENADKIAEALAGINPYYNEETLRGMLYKHLDITKQETAQRLAGQYAGDVEAFDRAEKEILSMADYLSSGIMQQFPQKFM